ncbi:NUDIX domain-containing protein, partial [Candidatus Dojkabacteria bacterium]|nr:NUDIX domain-containing protein [Candidatus Dojkabacteria bacterium]
IPYNHNYELLIQDRRGHKPPPWGFFGGGIEEGESPLEAVIRETEEELTYSLTEKDIVFLDTFERITEKRNQIISWVYTWDFRNQNLSDFTLCEGSGMEFMPLEKVYQLFKYADNIAMLDAFKQKFHL